MVAFSFVMHRRCVCERTALRDCISRARERTLRSCACPGGATPAFAADSTAADGKSRAPSSILRDPRAPHRSRSAPHARICRRAPRRPPNPPDDTRARGRPRASFSMRARDHRRDAACQRRDLPRALGFGRRLQMRRRAVVPSAFEPPDIAHDKFRLVVDRLQPRLVGEICRRLDACESPRRAARPHSSSRSSDRTDSADSSPCRSAPRAPESRRTPDSRGPARSTSAPSCAITRSASAHSRA